MSPIVKKRMLWIPLFILSGLPWYLYHSSMQTEAAIQQEQKQVEAAGCRVSPCIYRGEHGLAKLLYGNDTFADFLTLSIDLSLENQPTRVWITPTLAPNQLTSVEPAIWSQIDVYSDGALVESCIGPFELDRVDFSTLLTLEIYHYMAPSVCDLVKFHLSERWKTSL